MTTARTGSDTPLGTTDMAITRVGFGAWAIGGRRMVVRVEQCRTTASPLPRFGARSRAGSTGSTRRRCTASAIRSGSSRGRSATSRRPIVRTCSPRADSCGTSNSDGAAAIQSAIRPAFAVRSRIPFAASTSIASICIRCTGRPRMGRHIAEYWGTLLDLKRAGKIRAAGLSNHSAAQLEIAERFGHVDSLQPPFSAIRRDAALAEICPGAPITIRGHRLQPDAVGLADRIVRPRAPPRLAPMTGDRDRR